MKIYVDYEKAREAATGGNFTLEESEFGGFRDVGEGGVLSCATAEGGLRLAGDTDAGTVISADEIPIRPVSCDASCLKREPDGGVRLRVGSKIGGKE